VLSDSGGLLAIGGPTGGGFDSNPAWSRDDRWLAFLHTGPANGYDVPAPTLWLVSSGASQAQEVTTNGIGMFAWSPVASVLAYTVVSGGNATVAVPDNVWFDRPGSTPTNVAVGTDNGIGAIAWSPGGRQLAFDDTVYAQRATATSPATKALGRLGVVSADGGPVVTAYQLTETGIDLAGWWPDGGGLLFWEDPGFSDQADGETLDSLAPGNRHPVGLATSLVGSTWLAPEPDGHTVAVVVGAFRDIRAPGRHVDRCVFPAATCQAVPVPAASVGLAPSWSASGSLVFAVAPASPPFGPSDYSPGWMARWNAANALWTVGPGGRPSPLTSTPPGALLAVPAAKGNAMVVVADDGLWLAGTATAAPAVRVAGPLYSTIGPAGYYGEVDWTGSFAWSGADGMRQGSTQLLDEGLALPEAQLP
jgi:hypothetical protein